MISLYLRDGNFDWLRDFGIFNGQLLHFSTKKKFYDVEEGMKYIIYIYVDRFFFFLNGDF